MARAAASPWDDQPPPSSSWSMLDRARETERERRSYHRDQHHAILREASGLQNWWIFEEEKNYFEVRGGGVIIFYNPDVRKIQKREEMIFKNVLHMVSFLHAQSWLMQPDWKKFKGRVGSMVSIVAVLQFLVIIFHNPDIRGIKYSNGLTRSSSAPKIGANAEWLSLWYIPNHHS